MPELVQELIPSWVRIRGVIYPGHEKAPFTRSGQSVKGAIAYNSETDELQCHECGKWFEALAVHVRTTHALSVADYKRRHGLRQRTSLVNRRIQRVLAEKARSNGGGARFREVSSRGRSAQAARASVSGSRRLFRDSSSHYEGRNERGTCHAQLLEKIDGIVREFGETPAVSVFAARGVHLASLFDAFSVTGIPALMDKLGYGRNRGRAAFWKKPEVDLLDALRDFYISRARLPKEDEWGQGGLACQSTYRRAFGSTAEAYKRAGLGLVANSETGFRKRISDEAMLDALRRWYASHKTIPRTKDFQTGALPFHAFTLRNRFGSIIEAMKAAGIQVTESDYRRNRSGRWKTRINRNAIREAFIEFCEEHGAPPTSDQIKAGELGMSFTTIYKNFGTFAPEKLMKAIAAENGIPSSTVFTSGAA